MRKKRLIGILVLIFTLAMMLWIFKRITGTSCIIRGIIGIPCPGCGLTRSVEALISGDIYESLRYHPLTIPFVIFLVMYILSLWKKETNGFLQNKYIQIAFISIILITYIYRLYRYFPFVEPLVINDRAILLRIIEQVKAYY